MKNSLQIRLEKLAKLLTYSNLTEKKQSELDSLMDEAQQIMLCKAVTASISLGREVRGQLTVINVN